MRKYDGVGLRKPMQQQVAERSLSTILISHNYESNCV